MRVVIILVIAVTSCLILGATNCRGHQETRSCSSACGNIQDIHYPFQLTGDPIPNSYPHSGYELACENNRTILNLNSNTYFVLSIAYANFSMRIFDPGLEKKNYSSPFPLHNLMPEDLDIKYHLLKRQFNSPVAFISCRNPANSTLYVKSDAGSCTNRGSTSSHSYVLVGEHVDVGKIEDSCSITGATWFSTFVSPYQPARINRRYRGNMSLQEIYVALANGFELSWLCLNCSAVCGKMHCNIKDNNTIACISNHTSNSNSMPLSRKCKYI